MSQIDPFGWNFTYISISAHFAGLKALIGRSRYVGKKGASVDTMSLLETFIRGSGGARRTDERGGTSGDSVGRVGRGGGSSMYHLHSTDSSFGSVTTQRRRKQSRNRPVSATSLRAASRSWGALLQHSTSSWKKTVLVL